MSHDKKFLLEELKRLGVLIEDPDEYSNKELKEMLQEKGWVEPTQEQSSNDK